MSPGEFLASLKEWLARHPVRRPADEPQAGYTVQVMERVRLSRPVRAPAWGWLPRPQPILAFGGAAAAAAVGFVMLTGTPQRLAEEVDRDIEVLARVDPEIVAGLLEASLDGVAQEFELLNQMRLAEMEGVVDEEAWLEETLELLNDAGGLDDASDLPAADESLEELLQELEELDATDSLSS